jgi:hypothetical protein
MSTGLILEEDEEFRGRLRHCLDGAGMWTLTASTGAELTNALATGGVDVIVFGVRPDEQQRTLRLAEATKRCFPRTELVLISRKPLPAFEADVGTLTTLCCFEEPFALCLLQYCARQLVERHGRLNRLAHLARLLELTPGALNESAHMANRPTICVSRTGRVMFATATAKEVLRAVSAERITNAADTLDPLILLKLCDALKADDRPFETVLHRRDGGDSYYRAYLQAVHYCGEQGIVVFFQEASDLERDHIDPLWLGLLEQAARSRPDPLIHVRLSMELAHHE